MKELMASSIQKSINLSQSLYPDASLYSIGGYAIMNCRMNKVIFREAVNMLIWRHTALKYVPVNNPTDVFLSFTIGAAAILDVVDFSGEPFPEKAGTEWMRSDFSRNIFHDRPLLRTALIQISESKYYWYVKAHHLIADGFSMSIIFNQVMQYYNRLEKGEVSGNEIAPADYQHYVQDEIRYLASEAFKKDKAYWMEQLRVKPAFSPGFQEHYTGHQLASSRLEIAFDKAVFRQVKQYAAERNTTPFTCMLAVLAVTLSRLYQQESVCIDIPILNRTNYIYKRTIGPFLNVLPVYLSVGKDMVFADLLKVAAGQVKNVFRHGRFPMTELMGEEITRQERQRVVFSYQQFSYDIYTGGIPAEIIYLKQDHQEEDLAIHILNYYDDEDIRIIVDYKHASINAAAAVTFSETFQELLTCLTSGNDVSPDTVDLIPARNREAFLLSCFTGGSNSRMTDVIHPFFMQAASSPEALAIRFEDAVYTYAQVASAVQLLAQELITNYHVTRGAVIGIYMDRSPLMIISMLASLAAGACYLPLDPVLPAERVSYMLENSGTQLILASAEMNVDGITVVYPAELELLSGESINRFTLPAISPEELMYIIYTSGSTGKPKGVEITHGSVANFMTYVGQMLGIHAEDIILVSTTISFDISVLEIFLPLINGAALYLVSSEMLRHPDKLGREIDRGLITMMQGTPSLYNMLLENGWKGNHTLKILCGGEALDRQLAEKLYAKGACLWNMYGPTETTIWSAMHLYTPADKTIFVGRPFSETAIYVLDQKGCLLPPGFTGEIYIAGSGLAKGYRNNTALTAEKFLPTPFLSGTNMYRTGDAGRWTGGLLEVLGRCDEQLKVRGYRIEPGEIEHALLTHPDIKQAAVIAAVNIQGQTAIHAYLVVAAPVTVSQLRTFLKTMLPQYMLPAAYLLLPALPLTFNGKVDKKTLSSLEGELLNSGIEYVAPVTKEEKILVRLYEQVLGYSPVGIKDNFFDLGGHSLKASRLITLIHQETSVRLLLHQVLTIPVVEELAKELEALLWVKDSLNNISGINTNITI